MLLLFIKYYLLVMTIGVFDSGFGGLTVVSDLMRAFPYAKIVYVGDNARVPYGTKSKKTVQGYSRQIARFLISKKVDVIVVACNTASSVALGAVKEISNVPVVGMIDPVVDEAVNYLGLDKIGVIGTNGTINSKAYEKKIKKIDKKAKVISQACPLFVPIAEEGMQNHRISKIMAKEYLKNIKKSKVDCLILGCTHYPLFRDVIQEELGDKIKLLTCGEPASREVGKVIGKVEDLFKGRGRPVRHEFYSTDDIEKFKKIGSMFLGKKITKVKKLSLESLK